MIVPAKTKLTYNEWILLLTAFAAGAVDVISFATLGGVSGLKDVKIQSSVVVSYLFGALLSGALIVRGAEEVALLPFIGVAFAYVVHRRSQRKAVH